MQLTNAMGDHQTVPMVVTKASRHVAVTVNSYIHTIIIFWRGDQFFFNISGTLNYVQGTVIVMIIFRTTVMESARSYFKESLCATLMSHHHVRILWKATQSLGKMGRR